MINSRSSVIAVQTFLLRKRYAAAVWYREPPARLQTEIFTEDMRERVADPKLEINRRDWVKLWEDRGGANARALKAPQRSSLPSGTSVKWCRFEGSCSCLQAGFACLPPSLRPFCGQLPAVTFTSGCWQLSHRRGSAWDSHTAACMSDWRLALQLLAFKEHPPGPPVTVLLNKHATAQHSQEPTRLHGPLSICFMNLELFWSWPLASQSALKRRSWRTSWRCVWESRSSDPVSTPAPRSNPACRCRDQSAALLLRISLISSGTNVLTPVTRAHWPTWDEVSSERKSPTVHFRS